mgnify:CR=1 FL=1
MADEAAPATAWISLGSNQGPGASVFRSALQALNAGGDITLDALSSLYRTPPWGDTRQPDFLNAVARLETARSPERILASLLAIEERHGRRRTTERRWGPRTLDLDLLLVDGQEIDVPGLTLPHPRLHERAFVLVPLAELDPDIVIPGRGSVRQCLSRVPRERIERVAGPEWVAG